MPWSKPSDPKDNSRLNEILKQNAETIIKRYREKGETKYIIRNVGTGRQDIERLCAVMNSINEKIKEDGKTLGEKVRSIKGNVDLALTIEFEAEKNSQSYDKSKEIFDTMKKYFERLDNAIKSSGDPHLKLNYARNVYMQFDDRYRHLFIY